MLRNIWLLMLITGVSFFLLSIFLIFIFHVPDLLDELSGRKAKRQIKKLKELNLGTGALETANTSDIYHVVSTGSLLSNGFGDVTSNVNVSETIPNKVEDTEVTGDLTSIISESNTTFMDDSETSYIDNDATSLLTEVQEFSSNKRVVIVLEEQTSLE